MPRKIQYSHIMRSNAGNDVINDVKCCYGPKIHPGQRSLPMLLRFLLFLPY